MCYFYNTDQITIAKPVTGHPPFPYCSRPQYCFVCTHYVQNTHKIQTAPGCLCTDRSSNTAPRLPSINYATFRKLISNYLSVTPSPWDRWRRYSAMLLSMYVNWSIIGYSWLAISIGFIYSARKVSTANGYQPRLQLIKDRIRNGIDRFVGKLKILLQAYLFVQF